jgi:hypothetical protein
MSVHHNTNKRRITIGLIEKDFLFPLPVFGTAAIFTSAYMSSFELETFSRDTKVPPNQVEVSRLRPHNCKMQSLTSLPNIPK